MSENRWIVQPPKILPNANYNAFFRGVQDFTLPTTGELRWRFVWEIATGTFKGKEASALTDMDINPNALPGRLIAGLLGRDLVTGEDVKALIDGCIGKTYLVTVAGGPKGGKPGVQSCGFPPQM